MYIYGFEKLEVWQKARQFTSDIYLLSVSASRLLTKKFPKEELFGITNQIRRASISICSNIAEGVTRKTDKEKARFTQISYGSTVEVLNQLIISQDLNYITEDELATFRSKIEEITNKLNALHRAQLKRG